MPAMELNFSEPAWPELANETVIHTTEKIGVTALQGGMASGKPSVAFRIKLPDGKYVIAETSLGLFLSAADAFKARYGDPR